MTAQMLTQRSFEVSRQFIEQRGRSLDGARFCYAFDGAPSDTVIAELKHFQNPDGGFGHGLEPDLRTEKSSVLCTSIAFQVLRSIPIDPNHEIVASAIAFLLETFDYNENHWPIIPKAAQHSPHAPWWERSADEEQTPAFSLNPTAEILGYLYEYQHRVPETIIMLVTERVNVALSDDDDIEMHELLCLLRLMKTKALPDEFREQIYQTLARHIGETVERDPSQWAGYCLRPLQVVDAPDSPFMKELGGAIAANLDYEIETQGEDGSWKPTWSWGDMYPEAWERAGQDWSSAITLETVLTLKRFGRIEGLT
jgi:hypothetical protein